jgi:hypothetical protein
VLLGAESNLLWMFRALAASRSFLNLCPRSRPDGGWHLIASACRIGFGRNAWRLWRYRVAGAFRARIVRCRFAERFASCTRPRSSANSKSRALRSAPIWMSISSHALRKSKIIFKSKATVKIKKEMTEDGLAQFGNLTRKQQRAEASV